MLYVLNSDLSFNYIANLILSVLPVPVYVHNNIVLRSSALVYKFEHEIKKCKENLDENEARK